MSKRWTEKEDYFLVQFGDMVKDGYAFIAEHDLGRSAQAGRDRIKWLRKNKPRFVAWVLEKVAMDQEEADKRWGAS